MKRTFLCYFQVFLLEMLVMCVALPAGAQSTSSKDQVVEIRGVVLDEKGEPLPGATVLITRPQQRWGATAGVEGTFSIRIPKEIRSANDLYLTVSYIGFEEKRMKLRNDANQYRVLLRPDNKVMDEVIVTGYEVIDRRKTTSAISSVKMEDVLVPGMTTIDQALEGRIPDLLYIQNSGEVGSTARLRVRGTSTLIGNREPLWVLDGFVLQDPVDVSPEQLNDPDYINYVGNAISGINPQDIERIDVLKDASATALYGTRASNGVIVVTTKKGRLGPPSIHYSNQTKVTIGPRYTDRNINLMNSRERVQFGKDLCDLHYAFPSNMPMVGYEGAFYRYQSGQTSYADFLDEVSWYETVNTDWFDVLTRDAMTHAHTLSVSGGSEAVRYYVSMGYTRENGNIKTQYVDRYTTAVNLMTNFTQNLRANIRLNGNIQKKNHLPSDVKVLDYAYNTTRALPAYNADGSLHYYQNNGYEIGQGKTYNKYNYNIINEMNNTSDEYNGNTIISSADLNYSLGRILDLTAAASYSRSATTQATWYGEGTNYVAILRNGEVTDRPIPGETGKCELPYGGVYNTSTTISESLTARFQANLHAQIKGEHHNHLITSTLGYEVNTSRNEGISDQTRGYFKDRGMQYVKMTADDLDDYPLYKEWLAQGHRTITCGKTNQISGYLTLAYDLDNYFTLSANGRFDASNKFGSRSNEKFLPVWAVSGRWNLKDTFGKNWSLLDYWSLRASYGKTGNMVDGETPNLLIRQGTLDTFYGENVATVYRFPNPNLRWEQTNQTNVGMDLSLFDGRLSLGTDWWYKYTEDAFATIDVSPINGKPLDGRSAYTMNNGNITNWGYSFSVSGYPVRTKDWKLYMSTSYSWASNTVHTKTSDTYQLGDYQNGTAIIDGKSIGTFYSYKYLGLNPMNGIPMFDDYEDRMHLLMGLPLSQVVPMVMVESGNREPKFTGGLYTTLSWKQLSLNVNLNYSLGSKIRMFPIYQPVVSGVSSVNNVRKEFTDRWMRPGDESRTDIPALMSPGDPDYIKYAWHWSSSLGSINKVPKFAESVWSMYDLSDLRVVSGNYLRISSLSLNYNFTSRQLKRTPFKSLRFSFTASNLRTFGSRKLNGQDPTQANNEKAVLSIRPSYTLGFDVSF